MMIHINIRKYKKYALAFAGTAAFGMLLSGFFAVREQVLSETPVIKLEQEDIPTKTEVNTTEENTEETTASSILRPTLSTGILEEMINSDKLFAEYRMERQRLRGQETATLQEIIDNNETDSAVKEQASKRLIDIMEKEETEIRIEYLLKSTGIADCVVMLEGEEVNILLPIQLEEKKLQSIKEHVARITPVSEEKIYIVMRDETEQTAE